MKNLLILFAFVCCVSAEVNFRNSSANLRMKLLADCLSVSGLTIDEIKELKQKTQFTPLTANEQKFICCLSQTVIQEGKLVIERLQRFVDEKTNGAPVDLKKIVNDCEATGARANNLKACSDAATYAQCLFIKIRDILVDQKQSLNKGPDSDTNAKEDNDEKITP